MHTEVCLTQKICNKCGVEKKLDAFHRDRRPNDGRRSICKECRRSRKCSRCSRSKPRYEWYVSQNWCRGCFRSYVKSYNASHRATAVEIYGGRCVDCGTTESLQLDHVHGGGEQHRRTETTHTYVRRISKLGKRLDDVELQLLCAGCHYEKTEVEAGRKAAA